MMELWVSIMCPTEDDELSVYLFYQIYARQQVHPKVNEFPMNAFSGVLLLFQYKHVMVEELLQFFICEVNAKLFEPIVLRNQIQINIKSNKRFRFFYTTS